MPNIKQEAAERNRLADLFIALYCKSRQLSNLELSFIQVDMEATAPRKYKIKKQFDPHSSLLIRLRVPGMACGDCLIISQNPNYTSEIEIEFHFPNIITRLTPAILSVYWNTMGYIVSWHVHHGSRRRNRLKQIPARLERNSNCALGIESRRVCAHQSSQWCRWHWPYSIAISSRRVSYML